MTIHRSKLFRTILSFGLSALFLVLAFSNTDTAQLWQSLLDANYTFLLFFIPVGLASHWLRALRWKYLLEPVKPGVSVRNLFSAVMIGYLFNNVLPRAGELARPYAIGQLERISKSAALGTVVLERILDLVTFAFLLCLVLAIYPNSLDVFVSNVKSVRTLFFLGAIALFLLLLVLFMRTKSLFGVLKFVKPVLPHRFREQGERIIQSFLTGVDAGKSKRHGGTIAVLSLAIFGLYALTLYIAFFMFEPIVQRQLDFGAAAVLLTVSTVAFALPAPGAMGTYHSFLTFTLVALYHVDTATALSYSIVTHEVGYIVNSVVGLGFLLKDQVKVSGLGTASKEATDTIEYETSNATQSNR